MLVAEAYGWTWPEDPAVILEWLVVLHDERVAEEQRGHIRWLRPDYQRPHFGTADDRAAPLALTPGAAAPAEPEGPKPWPRDAIGQMSALRELVAAGPLTVEEASLRFTRAKFESSPITSRPRYWESCSGLKTGDITRCCSPHEPGTDVPGGLMALQDHGPGRSYWLDLFTGATWQEFLAAGGEVSGFRESRWKTMQRMKPGDYLLCYLTGISRFIAVFEVVSPPLRDRTPIWSDEDSPVAFGSSPS